MILSASRRTDIPAFYSRWFMTRLRAGYFQVRNPFNAKMVTEVHADPSSVDCIVFWTKDPRPFFVSLDELDNMGYSYYFQYTITPYDTDIESNMPDKGKMIEACIRLSERIGRDRVVLRYDPVLMTERYDLAFHQAAIEKTCMRLANYCQRLVFSFLDDYRKISKAMKAYRFREPTVEEMIDIGRCFAEASARYSIPVETCAEEIDLSRFGIGHAKCIDGDYIERLIGRSLREKNKKAAGRTLCGCMKSIDIGQYDSCIHDCHYCYANISKDKAVSHFKAHDPLSLLL